MTKITKKRIQQIIREELVRAKLFESRKDEKKQLQRSMVKLENEVMPVYSISNILHNLIIFRIIESNIKKESGWLRDYAKHSALNLGQVLRHLRYLTDLPDTPRNEAMKQRLRWIANDLYYTVTPGQWHHTQDELDELSKFTYADLLRMGFDPDFADKINKKTSPE